MALWQCVRCGATVEAPTLGLIEAIEWRELPPEISAPQAGRPALCPPCRKGSPPRPE